MNTDSPKPSASPNTPTLKAGDKLDKYEIVEQIGAGGMSVVWKAYDRLLDQNVAVKQIMPEIADVDVDQLHERFRREADLQKRVSRQSPHIVDVIDLIDEPRGMFIVMEYVDGPTLEQLLAEDGSPMEHRRAMGMIGAIALALQAMHEQKVIHRDLKPSNVLLPRAGGLKVTDFGLATVLDDQESLSLGSVRYMAPELFHDEPVEGRADIYSLGMMAYELLAGRKQFDEAFKIVLRDQRNQSLRWMKWHTNLRAKVQPLNKANPDISETLSDLVARMMEKDPTQRIESATQLLEAMRRHFAPTPASDSRSQLGDADAAASGTPAIDSVAPTAAVPKRSKKPMILAGVLVAQLLIAGGVFAHRMHEQKQQIRQAIEEARETYVDGAKAYDQGQYHRAITLFDEVAASRGMTARRAASFAQLAQGRIDMLEKNYEPAREKFYQVQEDDLLPTYRDKIQDLIDEVNKRISFEAEVTKIETAINAGNIGEARQYLAAQSTYAHTDEEDQILIALEARIGGQINQKHVEEELAEARRLESEGKRQEAIDGLSRAKRKYHSPKIDDELTRMRQDLAYANAIATAQEAEQSGDLAAAITGYKQAADIHGSEDLQSRIRVLKGRQLYDQARQAESNGDATRAQSLYTQAAGYGHDAAKQSIDRMKTSSQRDAYISAGDGAMASGEFEAAITQYESALRLGAGGDIRDRLTNAKVRLEVRVGQQLLSQGDTDGARAAFARAKELAPTNSAASQGLTDIAVRTEYMQLLASGDDLRAEGKFAAAKTAYRKARDVMTTDEIRKRLDDTEYEHLIAKVRFYMQKEEWPVAAAWLKAAAKIRDSEELRELHDIVKKHALLPGEEMERQQ